MASHRTLLEPRFNTAALLRLSLHFSDEATYDLLETLAFASRRAHVAQKGLV
jgi:hypothetical protein